MTVQCIRFISGENVVADVTEDTADSITIRDAIVAVPANQEGTQLGFVPFAPLQDPDEETLTVSKNFVMFITKLAPNLEEQYNNMFNRIVAPTKKLIV
tara:strand:+ start:361 stop:654 length:294 start_codon:yes stop_codon:yes gene_type:complete